MNEFTLLCLYGSYCWILHTIFYIHCFSQIFQALDRMGRVDEIINDPEYVCFYCICFFLGLYVHVCMYVYIFCFTWDKIL